MKQLHLICNAHLDPVWQWDWNEGATAALATFYSAAELADEYDYIFCHNEALLYEWIERYDPALFARIKALVEAGKWHIMGGWYIQPDCNIPSGEGFVRQIETGLTYFKEKFGARPTTAVNFDSFGHTQGLVQILNKTGYDSYIFCRPLVPMMELPHMFFEWKGLDGSSVKAARFEDDSIYCSDLGKAVENIKRKMRPWEGEDVAFALWGIGNHGGGPSRKDLREVGEFMQEQLGNGVQIMHSTPEQFFAAATPKASLDGALQPCFVKCYTSVSTLKRRYAELEDKLLMTEKICARAALETDFVYDKKAMDEAQRIMAMIQFHDVLSGTSILEGNVSSLRKADYALEILDEQFSRAFFKLYEGWERGKGGEYPFAVFNPHPYEIDDVFDLEMLLLNAVGSMGPDMYHLEVRDEHGVCVSQLTKESSTINMDRRKRVTVRAKLAPMSLTRFDVKTSIVDRVPVDRTPQTSFDLGGGVHADFCQKCGAMTGLSQDGKQYLGCGAFMPVSYSDNEDPWGWWLKTVSNDLTKLECKTSLRVIERGDVLTRMESEYTTGKSDVRVAYTLYNDLPYVDVKVNASWNDQGKGLKLEIPLKEFGKFIGQTSFGTQEYDQDLEQCSQRFVAVECGDKMLAVFKSGSYGCSVENGKLYLTLLNGSVYCAHPAGDLPILPDERYYDYIDLGVHEFSFRVAICERGELERMATEFCQKPYTLNVYPHGNGTYLNESPVVLSDHDITLSCFRKLEDETYMIRLFNNLDTARKCDCTVKGASLSLEFGKYEVKTLLYKNGKLCEHDSMLAI